MTKFKLPHLRWTKITSNLKRCKCIRISYLKYSDKRIKSGLIMLKKSERRNLTQLEEIGLNNIKVTKACSMTTISEVFSKRSEYLPAWRRLKELEPDKEEAKVNMKLSLMISNGNKFSLCTMKMIRLMFQVIFMRNQFCSMRINRSNFRKFILCQKNKTSKKLSNSVMKKSNQISKNPGKTT